MRRKSGLGLPFALHPPMRPPKEDMLCNLPVATALVNSGSGPAALAVVIFLDMLRL